MKGYMFGLLLAIMAIFAIVPVAAAVNIDYVRINGEQVNNNENLRIELGEDLDIRVRLTNDNASDVENVEVMARLVGFEYRDSEGNLVDIDGPFDLDEQDTVNSDLFLQFPTSGDKDEYELRITVGDRRSDYDEFMVTLRVKDPRTALQVRDVILSPSNRVEAGRALLVQARVENLGTRDLDDVVVTASIPGLGVEGSSFLDETIDGSEFGDGDVETSEEILLRIPVCAKPGTYDVEVTVEYDRYEETTVVESIDVVSGESCVANTPSQPVEQKTTVVPPQAQNVQIGASGASFPVVITNMGTSSRTYTVSTSGLTEWGVAQVSEPVTVVRAGESKIVYVFVSANDNAVAGQKVFMISVNDQSFPVVANVVAASASSWSGIRRALEIGLIILVVLLIVLGLIVGFSRLRNDEKDQEGKTYY